MESSVAHAAEDILIMLLVAFTAGALVGRVLLTSYNRITPSIKKVESWIQSEEKTKVVTKPWGNGVIDGVEGVGELWLNYRRGEEVGEEEKKYVFKKLFIKEGTRTSFQYHVNKLETNYLISGEAKGWMENELGEMEMSHFAAGDAWTIPNGRKHRLVALTDLVMLEASTPEVDDVVRIKDDTNRPGGRIEPEHKNESGISH